MGGVCESPEGMLRRVARAVAQAEERHGGDVSAKEEAFFQMMARLDFLPNSPTLMNAGTPRGQLAACYVIPVEDSLDSIFEAVRSMALVHQGAGGTGFSFSCLRPRGDMVRSVGGIASGPVSFMRVFDETTEVVKHGGRRRGANMGVLSVHHPDVLEFVRAKAEAGALSNFNISVAVTDRFLEALALGGDYPLANPRGGGEVGKLEAGRVFDEIVHMAWLTGDPGILFIDEINRHNPTPHLGLIESTNPCGEQPLLPYEACNLGSINLARMVACDRLDWEKLRATTRLAVDFLDDVIDVNHPPLPRIGEMVRLNRKIGLGVMGFAEMLIQLGVPYDSVEALEVGRSVMRAVQEEAHSRSRDLAEERGPFPSYPQSRWARRGEGPLRNATLTTVAPTGTISIIAGTSGGIEPLFAVAFRRRVLDGQNLMEVNPLFARMAEEAGIYSPRLVEEVALRGTLAGIRQVDERLRRLFVTAFEVPPVHHVRMQAAFQEYCDNAVSKTVNLPREAGEEEVRQVFLEAHRLRCKGVTVFRYGCKREQVLYVGSEEGEEQGAAGIVADAEFAGECRACAI